jgi:hypothetical protein
VFERAKTVHDLDRAAILVGTLMKIAKEIRCVEGKSAQKPLFFFFF